MEWRMPKIPEPDDVIDRREYENVSPSRDTPTRRTRSQTKSQETQTQGAVPIPAYITENRPARYSELNEDQKHCLNSLFSFY